MTEHNKTIQGVNMAWQESGQGEAVIFLHGLPTSPRLWRHVMPLIHDARCLAWEMVGYGTSIIEGRGRDISLARQANYLITWMDELEIREAVLVGHDLGGGVGQIAAVRDRLRVRGLVLVNSVCYDSWPIPSVKMLRAMAPLIKRLPDALLEVIFKTLFIRGHETSEQVQEAFEQHWPPYTLTDGAGALVHQIMALDVHDTRDIAGQLPRLHLPARIVWGAADRFQKIHYGERLASDLNAPLTRIETGKHFVPEDHPDEIVAAIHDLLHQLHPSGTKK